ncbi:DoxX family protein [Candidatus Woesearchaeota archaeon]|nr:DoxX family protein [Candidatus Woesearchaeota archaeon]
MAKENGNGGLALTLLRFVLGVIFAAHGYAKLFVPGGFAGTAEFFKAIGIPLAAYSALLVAVVEFAGGILLVLGLASRWASAVLIIEMLVALAKVHAKQGFFISQKAYGYEFVLLILAVLFVLMVKGPGAISLGKKYFKTGHLH